MPVADRGIDEFYAFHVLREVFTRKGTKLTKVFRYSSSCASRAS
jgi:hypothetical protein